MAPGIMEVRETGSAVSVSKVEIKPLGAGQEVGRSCIIVKYMCAVDRPRSPSFSACRSWPWTLASAGAETFAGGGVTHAAEH